MLRIILFTSLIGLLLRCPRPSHAHGRLWDPPSRSSMWRRGFNTPANYNDMELFCGGLNRQVANGYRCGVCGDPYDAADKPNEAGGIYATGQISRAYRQASDVRITVWITANHRGFFEFRICPVTDPDVEVTQGCLDNHLLSLADGSNTSYAITTAMGNNNISVDVTLPADLVCTRCVLQWRYHAGNSWGWNEDGTGCIGCGRQEEFYGCADVQIVAPGVPLPRTILDEQDDASSSSSSSSQNSNNSGGPGASSVETRAGSSGSATGNEGNSASSTGNVGNSASSTGNVGNSASSTGNVGNSASSTGNVGNSASSTGNVGNSASSTGNVGNSASSTGNVGNSASSTGNVGNSASSTGNVGNSASSTGNVGNSASSTGNVGNSASSAGNEGNSASSSGTGDNLVCYGVRTAREDRWCQLNCQMNYCPASHCRCVTQPYPHLNPQPTGCRARGGYAELPGYHEWCRNNCPRYCPGSICVC